MQIARRHPTYHLVRLMRILTDFFSAEIPRIDTALHGELATLSSVLKPVAMHIAALPGKRLRPLICLTTARCLGETGDSIYPLAAALEILHCASLLHDDILDEARTRRGATAAHLKFNAKLALLAGDAMFALSGEIVARSRNPHLMAIFSAAIRRAAEGQALESARLFNPVFDPDHYTEVIAAKTAALFEASALAGAEAAAATQEQRDAAASFGFNFGMAFQIMDDIRDFFPTPDTGKPQGGDLLQGKLTLPAFHLFETCKSDNKRILLDKFSKKILTANDVDLLCTQIHAQGLDKGARFQAETYARQGNLCLAPLPSSQFKDILKVLIHVLL